MTTERKRWWRVAALAVVGGVAVTGGYRLVRATPAEETRDAEQSWTRAVTTQAPPTELPTVAEVERTSDAAPSAPPVTGAVTPVSATLPIPALDSGDVVAPAVPVAPVAAPSIPTPPIPVPPVPAPPVPVPVLPASAPTMPPITTLPAIEPVTAPRLPEPGATPAEKTAIPMVPNTTVIPVADLPTVPLPKPPITAAPGGAPPMLPALPSLPGTPEPPKSLPLNPPTPVTPLVPQPSGTTPAVPPVKPPASTQPMLPSKSDSGLNLPNSGNTLNPTVPPLQPITPMPLDRGTQGTAVDRAKPPEPNLSATDKFVFPVPVVPTSTDPHRDDPMFKLTTTAAFAVLSGALLSADKANSFPTVPPITSVIPMPGGMVKDDKQDIEKLKTDLEAANKKITKTNEKIDDLEKRIKDLTEILQGKKDSKEPFEQGAIARIADLHGKIESLQKELNDLKKSQTSLKPAATTEVKQTGIVKIINEYPVEISIVVNNASHRVAPNKTLDVEVPAGDFSYQLLTAGAPLTNSKIGKGETVRLRIK